VQPVCCMQDPRERPSCYEIMRLTEILLEQARRRRGSATLPVLREDTATSAAGHRPGSQAAVVKVGVPRMSSRTILCAWSAPEQVGCHCRLGRPWRMSWHRHRAARSALLRQPLMPQHRPLCPACTFLCAGLPLMPAFVTLMACF
jgi:hypothetical protein